MMRMGLKIIFKPIFFVHGSFIAAAKNRGTDLR
jgi:hypothetical protein